MFAGEMKERSREVMRVLWDAYQWRRNGWVTISIALHHVAHGRTAAFPAVDYFSIPFTPKGVGMENGKSTIRLEFQLGKPLENYQISS
jgi:hypothetical protein